MVGKRSVDSAFLDAASKAYTFLLDLADFGTL